MYFCIVREQKVADAMIEAPKELLKKLVEDADLVADVGVRLGLIKSVEFLTALREARNALAKDSASHEVIAELQKWLNSVVNGISPITLDDLRAGRMENGLGTRIFGVFCIVLLSFLLLYIAYMTQLYDRATSLYAMTLELQEARGAEQTIRLFGLLKKNQDDMLESLKTGKKDFLYEVFNKALFDLQMINIKTQAYEPIANRVLKDLDIHTRLWDRIVNPRAWFTGKDDTEYANPDKAPPLAVQPSQSAPGVATDPKLLDILSSLDNYFTEVKNFTSSIQVRIDPLVPTDYTFYLSPLREGISMLGSWILPFCYGMLGAVIFYMRRLLQPSLPSPSPLRSVYRIVLGSFAGIVTVWFWTPSPQKLTQPAFATLTSFGIAFLVGFSTDIFFQALDRLVNYLSQALGKPGT